MVASESKFGVSNKHGMPQRTKMGNPVLDVTTTAPVVRLDNLLVMELTKDRNRSFLELSIRRLYKHVVSCIKNTRTTTIPTTIQQGNVTRVRSTDNNNNNNTNNESPMADFGASTNKLLFNQQFPKPTIQQQQVTYRERLGGYIHPRDMRRLVTHFSSSNEPEIIVRRHVILMNFDPLRAIILRDRILILVPDGADSILADMEKRIRGGSDDIINSIFGEVHHPNSESHHSHNSGTEKLKKWDINNDNLVKHSSSVSNQTEPISTANETVSESTNNQHTNLATDKNDSITQPLLSNNAADNVDAQIMDNDNDDGDGDDEWDEMEGRGWIDLPFELHCVDAVLFVVGSILTAETQDIELKVDTCLKKIMTHGDSAAHGDNPFTSIRAIKDTVNEMSSRVKSFLQSINRVLDEDEDMALMNLSRLLTHPQRFIQPVPPQVLEEESDEPELILEANLQIVLSISNNLNLIQGKINTASELLDKKSDSIRNRLLFANMLINVYTLALTAASVVGSFFGMNIPNPLENNHHAWNPVTYGSLAGSVILTCFILCLLVYSGAIPRSSFSRIIK